MKWFKAISPNDPIIKPIMDELGFEGYGRFLAVLDYCQRYDLREITEEVLANSAGTNRRGAKRLLPMFRECLVKVWVMFGESFTNVSPNNDQSLGKLDPQNPHGSTRAKEENRLEEKEEKSEKKFSEDDRQTAVFIFEKIRSVNPTFKQPNLNKWAADIRLMVQQDKRSYDAIKELFSWANQDGFWKANILSPNKLREKWDTLTMQKQRPKPTAAFKGSQIPAGSIVLAPERKGGSGQL
jgi:hypothetical protein